MSSHPPPYIFTVTLLYLYSTPAVLSCFCCIFGIDPGDIVLRYITLLYLYAAALYICIMSPIEQRIGPRISRPNTPASSPSMNHVTISSKSIAHTGCKLS
ncbi:uncharacterized protein C8R40DRAFT_745730 [Lentinula edodes]|uniref:uncharacterized protein n=1 Tax=Lentinula edodes TaxID=5353 RepID=UPI001E8D6D53|nr:uncharacterized protein C8R40DRAFT_745730 [Lentinula edodes]KAH7869323.1 hypothetical protein C8R40DRAFT_745730 [Lentinula edodes]